METKKAERDIASLVAKNIENFIDNQFILKRDPFGKKWAIDKDGNLFDPDGVIHDSIKVKAKGNEVEISSSLDYTIYHQTGTAKMPQRMIYPEDELPKKWEKKMQESINEVMEGYLEGIGGGR